MISDDEFEDLIRQTLRRRAEDVEEDLGDNLVHLQTDKAIRWRTSRRIRSLSFVAALLAVAGVGVLLFGQYRAEDSELTDPAAEPGPVYVLPESYEVLGGEIYSAFHGPPGFDVKQYVLWRSDGSDNSGSTVVSIRRMPYPADRETGPFFPEDSFGLEVTRTVRSLGEDTLVVTVFPPDLSLATQILEQLVDQPELALDEETFDFDPPYSVLADVTYSLDDLATITGLTVSVDGQRIRVTATDLPPAIQMAELVFEGRAATIRPLEDGTGWRISSADMGWNAILWEIAPGQSTMVSGDVEMSEIETVAADLQVVDVERWREAVPNPSPQD